MLCTVVIIFTDIISIDKLPQNGAGTYPRSKLQCNYLQIIKYLSPLCEKSYMYVHACV